MISYILLIICTSMYASAPIYKFDRPEQRQVFEDNLSQYRCLVCQNESLLDSQAPLAKDLRDEIYKQIIHGKSNKDIHDFLVSRYGNFIELSPTVNSHTSILWCLPVIAIIVWLVRALIFL